MEHLLHPQDIEAAGQGLQGPAVAKAFPVGQASEGSTAVACSCSVNLAEGCIEHGKI